MKVMVFVRLTATTSSLGFDVSDKRSPSISLQDLQLIAPLAVLALCYTHRPGRQRYCTCARISYTNTTGVGSAAEAMA